VKNNVFENVIDFRNKFATVELPDYPWIPRFDKNQDYNRGNHCNPEIVAKNKKHPSSRDTVKQPLPYSSLIG
jgi:hypothetical protein